MRLLSFERALNTKWWLHLHFIYIAWHYMCMCIYILYKCYMYCMSHMYVYCMIQYMCEYKIIYIYIVWYNICVNIKLYIYIYCMIQYMCEYKIIYMYIVWYNICVNIKLYICILYDTIYVCVCVCVYIYIYIHTHTCIVWYNIYVNTCILYDTIFICVFIYIYIYIYWMVQYVYVCDIHGAFNKFPDFVVQAFEIIVDSWKFSILLLYILWNDWPIFMISGSKEQLQQQLEYTLLKPDCHSCWISKMQSDTLEEWYPIKFCFKLGKKCQRNIWNASDCFSTILYESSISFWVA